VHVESITRPDWPVDFARVGQLNGAPVVLVANGPGPKLAGAAVDVVKEHTDMTGLVSIGFCGGLQRWLNVFDIFVATEVVDVGPALSPTSPRPFKTGKLLSIDRVLSTAREKSGFGRLDAVEMEAAAVAARAQQWNVPFYAVRVVTDASYETFFLDFNQMRNADGRFSRARILGAALLRPLAVFPELIELNRRTKRAAQALGEFLADSRF